MNWYRNWRYGDNGADYHPATGRWFAESFGVEMSAATETAIREMIDQRCVDYPPDGHGGPIFPNRAGDKNG